MLAELENVKMVTHTDMEVSIHWKAKGVGIKPLSHWLHLAATVRFACSGVQKAVQSHTTGEAGHSG